jgi:hypothetical protein
VLAVARPWRFESSPGHHPIDQGFKRGFTGAHYSSPGVCERRPAISAARSDTR